MTQEGSGRLFLGRSRWLGSSLQGRGESGARPISLPTSTTSIFIENKQREAVVLTMYEVVCTTTTILRGAGSGEMQAGGGGGDGGGVLHQTPCTSLMCL